MIDELYKQKIELAEKGDREAAKWLIKAFCSTIKQNRDAAGKPYKKPSGIHTQFDEGLLDYLFRCFQSIDEGLSPDKALGLKGESGRESIPEEKLLQRECDWCLEVIRLRNSGKYPLLKNAKKQAARKFKVSVSAIEKAWKKSVPKCSAVLTYNLEKEDK